MADDPYNAWARAFANECARTSDGNLDPHQASTLRTRSGILLRWRGGLGMNQQEFFGAHPTLHRMPSWLGLGIHDERELPLEPGDYKVTPGDERQRRDPRACPGLAAISYLN